MKVSFLYNTNYNCIMIMRIHRFLGITLVFFLIVLSITGTLLQHAEDFGIREKFVSSTIVSNLYDIKPCQVNSFKIDDQWVSICNSNLYFNEKKIANNISSISSVSKKDDYYMIRYGNHELKVNNSAEIINIKHLYKISSLLV